MKRLLNAIIEKDEKGNLQLSKSGITLIALVITIVVLIILASLVIGLTLGENGLLNRTKQAKEDYLVKANEEQIELAKAGTLESTRDTVQGSVPAGTIISYMGNNAPTGYLKCDGTEYNISDYQVLADQIKTEFGSYNKFGGDGTTTFKVPNLQGEFLRGAGTNSYTNQGSGGTVGEHQDGTKNLSGFIGKTYIGFYYPNEGSSNEKNIQNEDYIGNNSASGWSSVSTGFNSTTNNHGYYTSRPTNTSVLYCIKY